MRGKQKKDPQIRTAVIYARFSSHNQREESIEQQVAECKLFAKANKYDVIDIYADTAKTGKTERRPQFQKLKREAEKRKFAYIIAYKSNRIARNLLNALQFENDMGQLGIEVLYAKEEFGNNAAGRFALRTMMNVNQFYSENLGEDIKRNQADNAQNCKANGPASFGYKSGEDGKFVIDEQAASIVREIFVRVAEHEAFVDIANDFNNRGLKTRQGNPWGKSSFANILHNERYMGVYIFDNVRIDGGMPPIISKELFYKVQDVLKNKKNPQGRHRENGDYLLTGKIFCGECGSHMVGVSGTGRSAMYYYYVCNEKRTKGGCKKKAVRREQIEYQVANAVKSFVMQDEIIQMIADTTIEYQKIYDHSSEVSLLQTQLDEIDKSLKNVMTAIEQGIITATTKSRLLELETEKSNLTGKIALIKAEDISVTKEQLIAWLKSFQDGDARDKAYQERIFNAFLKAVYLYDDDKAKLTFNMFDRSDPTKHLGIDIPVDLSGNGATADGSYKLLHGSPPTYA